MKLFILLVALSLGTIIGFGSLHKSTQDLHALALSHIRTLNDLDKAKADLVTVAQERDQYAAAFLKALEAEAACDAQYKAMLEKRFYAGE